MPHACSKTIEDTLNVGLQDPRTYPEWAEVAEGQADSYAWGGDVEWVLGWGSVGRYCSCLEAVPFFSPSGERAWPNSRPHDQAGFTARGAGRSRQAVACNSCDCAEFPESQIQLCQEPWASSAPGMTLWDPRPAALPECGPALQGSQLSSI